MNQGSNPGVNPKLVSSKEFQELLIKFRIYRLVFVHIAGLWKLADGIEIRLPGSYWSGRRGFGTKKFALFEEFFWRVGCGEAVGRSISKPQGQPNHDHSIRYVSFTDRETHQTSRKTASRAWYVPRSLGDGGVYEMLDVVDAV